MQSTPEVHPQPQPRTVHYRFRSPELAAAFGAATGYPVVAGHAVVTYAASSEQDANLWRQNCAAFESAQLLGRSLQED
jgi:hypothetical protein